ncbi:hypothetical protein EPI10_033508 [Gossypium australe]|uniref:Uncharacterized protein n=1 Tax=Gossypium australe TaxID=47621 RepID=A0A5B6XAT0_9ROSI|nr:hypothetical protein EPI10_033508 [Gossypium australe]
MQQTILKKEKATDTATQSERWKPVNTLCLHYCFPLMTVPFPEKPFPLKKFHFFGFPSQNLRLGSFFSLVHAPIPAAVGSQHSTERLLPERDKRVIPSLFLITTPEAETLFCPSKAPSKLTLTKSRGGSSSHILRTENSPDASPPHAKKSSCGSSANGIWRIWAASSSAKILFICALKLSGRPPPLSTLRCHHFPPSQAAAEAGFAKILSKALLAPRVFSP